MAPSMHTADLSRTSCLSQASEDVDTEQGTPSSSCAPFQRTAGGVPRVASLVFDIELDESSKGAGQEDDQPGTMKLLKSWLEPKTAGELQLRKDVEMALEQHRLSSSAIEANQWLASRLGRLGYRVHIRTALGGGEGFECLRNLRHVFLFVMAGSRDKGPSEKFIVDLTFKEQFQVAKPTDRYKQLLDCLPDVYVAPEAAVTPLVNFLCQEIACAFRANGTVLPPWRHVSSMLSKWMPRKSLDEQVSSWSRSGSNSSATAGQSQASAAAVPGSIAAAAVASQQQAQALAASAAMVGAGMHASRRSLEGGHAAVHQPIKGHWAVPPGAIAQQAVQVQLGMPRMAGMQGPAKPIACEPRKVVVGGNFVSVGLAQ